MAFRRLKYYTHDLKSTDPRIDPTWAINSINCVISVTPYRTFKEMITNDPEGIANTKMIGSISNYSRNENINISTHYDIGNKNPIFIPGKMGGQLTLNSLMLESVNLLGSIYEVLLTAFERKYQIRFQNLRKKIMNIPNLTSAYFENPNTISLEERDANIKATSSIATADGTTPDLDTMTSDGAILMSLSDIRTRLKFGIALIVFQSEKRIKSDIDFTTESTAQPIADPIETRSDFYNTMIPDKNYSNTSGESAIENYRILSGVFLENCIIQNYSIGLESNSAVASPIENVSVLYASASNIKANLDKKAPPTLGTNTAKQAGATGESPI